MKQNTSIIFIVGLLAFLSIASASCSNHPGWAKAKSYIQNLASQNAEIKTAVENVIASFDKQSASTSSESDLGVCSAYANQKSCCTKSITDFFDKVVLFKTKPLLKADNIFNKFLKFMVKTLNAIDCSAKSGLTKPKTVEQFKALGSSVPELQTLIDGDKTCKLQFVKQISSLARGAVCFACAGSENLSNYIDPSGKYILSQSSVSKFQEAAKNAIDCTATLFDQAKLYAAAKATGSYLLDPATNCLPIITDGITQYFLNKISSKDSNNVPVCKGLSLFNQDTACENAIAGSIDAAATAARFLESNPIYRILADDSVQASTPTGGIQSFVTSPTDDKVTEDGTISIPTDFTDTFGKKETFSLLLLSFLLLLI